MSGPVRTYAKVKQSHGERTVSPRGVVAGRDAREALFCAYREKLHPNRDLNRVLVSFQANKTKPFYRWFKYKEAFSSTLVQYVIERFRPDSRREPHLLDPFAGVGTAVTVAAEQGWNTTGIELLPVGIAAVRARISAETVKARSFQYHLSRLKRCPLNGNGSKKFGFRHLHITEGAFPPKTERALSSYRGFLEEIRDPDVRYLFWFAGLSVLEEVSFTRKDGQYLRWDYRSGKSPNSHFSKGRVYDFDLAVTQKLNVIWSDIASRNRNRIPSKVRLIEGSCLNVLPDLPASSFDLVITSPPYCNRYDYTRTYALELACCGCDEDTVKRLRQDLLSCTVENKTKKELLARSYDERGQRQLYDSASTAFFDQEALQEVLRLLYEARERGDLNNNNIPNMVENYFFEMNLVIHELSRALRPGGRVVMVNDNVQYYGEEVPVDLILSDFAARAGLVVDHIWVLPNGKGNSSQQMGAFGRTEIRKCVYVWSKRMRWTNSC